MEYIERIINAKILEYNKYYQVTTFPLISTIINLSSVVEYKRQMEQTENLPLFYELSESLINFAKRNSQHTHYMNEIEIIRSKIHEIRGQKVMLDYDLAEMYGVETKVLKQAVKRNISRFPSDFMFELNKSEFDFLRSQFVTSKKRGGNRYLPYAFTEQGVAMLSSVLNSEIAIQINISIIRAFVAVRKIISVDSLSFRLSALEKNFEELKQDLEEIFTDYNDINEDTRAQLEAINTSLAELQSKTTISPRRSIGFK